jgi:hypothetical protein
MHGPLNVKFRKDNFFFLKLRYLYKQIRDLHNPADWI